MHLLLLLLLLLLLFMVLLLTIHQPQNRTAPSLTLGNNLSVAVVPSISSSLQVKQLS